MWVSLTYILYLTCISTCHSSYIVPFEEDPKNPNTWYFDHNYHEAMYAMFKKVNSTEKVVGWYSTGPLLRPSDIQIHEVVRQYVTDPVFVIVDVRPKVVDEIPTKAYLSLPSPSKLASSKSSTAGSIITNDFVNILSVIDAEEAEEVGVTHLLREVQHTQHNNLHDILHTKLQSLQSLHTRLSGVSQYLDKVDNGVLQADHAIVSKIQQLLSLIPQIASTQLVAAFNHNAHDSLAVTYVASLVRSITSLHKLIENKMLNRAAEKSSQLLLLAKKQQINEQPDDGVDMDSLGQEGGA